MTSFGFLTRQFTHVVWADEACLAAAATVSGHRFGETFGFSFGSVHATLVHMLGAQDVWLRRLTGENDPTFPDPAGLSTLDAIDTRWAGIHDQWREYLGRQSESGLDATLELTRRGQQFRTTLRTVLGHVFDHATVHRGQLNSLIKLAGGTPFDYGQMTWSRATGETIDLK